MHLDIYESVWFKLGMVIDTIVLYILTLTLIQSHRSVRKQKLLHQLSKKNFNRFEWNLICCWDLLVWSHTHFILSIQYSRERTLLMWFYLKQTNKKKPKQTKPNTFSIVLYSDIYRLISFKLGMMRETTKLFILILVWMTFTFIQGHCCRRYQNFGVHFFLKFFLANLSINFAHAKVSLHKYSSRERTVLTWFYEIYVKQHHLSGHLWTDLFQSWYDAWMFESPWCSLRVTGLGES